MVSPDDAAAIARAHEPSGCCSKGVVALEGSISGEHGIGFSKAPYLASGTDAGDHALMRAVKAAFDPHGILNPGKMF